MMEDHMRKGPSGGKTTGAPCKARGFSAIQCELAILRTDQEGDILAHRILAGAGLNAAE